MQCRRPGPRARAASSSRAPEHCGGALHARHELSCPLDAQHIMPTADSRCQPCKACCVMPSSREPSPNGTMVDASNHAMEGSCAGTGRLHQTYATCMLRACTLRAGVLGPQPWACQRQVTPSASGAAAAHSPGRPAWPQAAGSESCGTCRTTQPHRPLPPVPCAAWGRMGQGLCNKHCKSLQGGSTATTPLLTDTRIVFPITERVPVSMNCFLMQPPPEQAVGAHLIMALALSSVAESPSFVKVPAS